MFFMNFFKDLLNIADLPKSKKLFVYKSSHNQPIKNFTTKAALQYFIFKTKKHAVLLKEENLILLFVILISKLKLAFSKFFAFHSCCHTYFQNNLIATEVHPKVSYLALATTLK